MSLVQFPSDISGNLYNSKFQNLLKQLKEQDNQKNYQDPDFPPSLKSVCKDPLKLQANQCYQKIIWIPANQIYKDCKLFVGKIEPTDIRQGLLGNCYFLSTISSLAEIPSRIERLFSHHIENNNGVYCVKICHKGYWKEVIIDNYIPCINLTRQPAFTRGVEGEIWVMLLEKAWAKLYGSYDDIESGFTRECLHDLTCAPTQTLWLDNPDDLDSIWKKLIFAEKQNFAMTCSSRADLDENLLTQMGLVKAHAYSLLAAYDVNLGLNQIVRLVKLRNPWGDGEWKGKWNDNDENLENLSNENKQLIAWNKNSRDGTFFMEYKDFAEYFSNLQICYVYDHFKYSSMLVKINNKQTKYFAFRVTEKGKYFITINQAPKRLLPKDKQAAFQYSTVTVLLIEVQNGNKFALIEGKQGADREVWTSEQNAAEILPGDYIICVKVQWRYEEENNFTLSSYGQAMPAILKEIERPHPLIKQQAYFAHALENQNLKTKRVLKDGSWTMFNQTDDGYFYLAAENKSDKQMNCVFVFNQLTGMKLKKPFSGNRAEFILQKGQHQVILIRVKSYNRIQKGISYSQSIQFL